MPFGTSGTAIIIYSKYQLSQLPLLFNLSNNVMQCVVEFGSVIWQINTAAGEREDWCDTVQSLSLSFQFPFSKDVHITSCFGKDYEVRRKTVPGLGFEPLTLGSKFWCSTDWAICCFFSVQSYYLLCYKVNMPYICAFYI